MEESPLANQSPVNAVTSVASAAFGHARLIRNIAILLGVLIVVGVMIWQALTANGNPDPTAEGISPTSAVLQTGVLVFREGLEAILVLTALTASLVRTGEGYWKPIALGAGASFLASVATWFIVVALISAIEASTNVPALNIQAATGLLAIAVLLVIMNWFFHNVYWAGWITMHNRRKRDLIEAPGRSRANILRGLALIGFTSVYREGFEVVLFLQSLRLKVGSHLIFAGVLAGLSLTCIVAVLTFVLHYRLPYKKMLVLTGMMLGAVLVVMVGESVQEMQQANWLSATAVHIAMPDWMNTWFAVFPTRESLIAQVLTIVFVVGSYYLARRVCIRRAAAGPAVSESCMVPDCESCKIGQSEHHAVRLPTKGN